MQSHLVCEIVCPVTSLTIRRHRIIIPHRGEPALAVVPEWEKTRYQITALPSPPTSLPILKITFGVFCPSPAWGKTPQNSLRGPLPKPPRRAGGDVRVFVSEQGGGLGGGERHPGCCTSGWVRESLIRVAWPCRSRATPHPGQPLAHAG